MPQGTLSETPSEKRSDLARKPFTKFPDFRNYFRLTPRVLLDTATGATPANGTV